MHQKIRMHITLKSKIKFRKIEDVRNHYHYFYHMNLRNFFNYSKNHET